MLSSNVALIGGNSTKPGSGYYALIKAVLSLRVGLNIRSFDRRALLGVASVLQNLGGIKPIAPWNSSWLKEEGELRAKAKALAIPATPNAQAQAHAATNAPVDGISGAAGGGMDEAGPDVPAGVCLYIRKLLALANDHEILKGASFQVPSDTNELCQRMASEVHRDLLPGDSHVTAMGPFKGEFGLRASATTAPGLLKVMFVAMANRKIRVNEDSSGSAPHQPREYDDGFDVENTLKMATGCRQNAADVNEEVTMPLDTNNWVYIPPTLCKPF